MSFDVRKEKDWLVIDIKDRVDSFSHREFCQSLDEAVEKGEDRVALQLRDTRFLSLPTIKHFSGVAEKITQRGGQFALVGTPEKIKRQIDIFATLDTMEIYRSKEDWQRLCAINS